MSETQDLTRRQVLAGGAMAVTAIVLGERMTTAARAEAPIRMTRNLSPGRIGLRIDQRRAIELAARHGFQSVDPYAGFLGALRDIGYDGPVRAEPFAQELEGLEAEEAVARVSTAMQAAWNLLGG